MRARRHARARGLSLLREVILLQHRDEAVRDRAQSLRSPVSLGGFVESLLAHPVSRVNLPFSLPTIAPVPSRWGNKWGNCTGSFSGAPQRALDSLGCLDIHTLHSMRVEVHGDPDRAVTQPLARYFHRDACT